MYLLHYVVAVVFNAHGFFPRLSDNPNWNAFLASMLVLLPVTLVFSGLTYALIERPFLALRGEYLGEPFPRRVVDGEPYLTDRGASEPV
jgi:peptidoglycan/LPS O-acetylase OafA/YrhL